MPKIRTHKGARSRFHVTGSGKIMRRILQKIAAGKTDEIGDTSTIADPAVIDSLIADKDAAS